MILEAKQFSFKGKSIFFWQLQVFCLIGNCSTFDDWCFLKTRELCLFIMLFMFPAIHAGIVYFYVVSVKKFV